MEQQHLPYTADQKIKMRKNAQCLVQNKNLETPLTLFMTTEPAWTFPYDTLFVGQRCDQPNLQSNHGPAFSVVSVLILPLPDAPMPLYLTWEKRGGIST